MLKWIHYLCIAFWWTLREPFSKNMVRTGDKMSRQRYLWKWRQSAVPDTVPQNFSPVIAFVSHTWCLLQAMKERDLFSFPSPRFKTVGNLFLFWFGAHEFGISTIADHLIFDLKQFLNHINNHAVISIMLNVLGVVILVSIYDCACVLKKTLIFLGSKSLCSTRYVMDGTHAQSLNKWTSPLSHFAKTSNKRKLKSQMVTKMCRLVHFKTILDFFSMQ